MVRGVRFAQVLVACGLASLLLATAASAAFPGQNGKIAFDHVDFSDDSHEFQIHVMNPDGSGVQRLTVAAGGSSNPRWSANGRQIVFTSTRDGDGDIYVMDADGANQRQVTSGPAEDTRPSLSPDGRRIVFQRYRGGYDLFTVEADGSDLHALSDGQGGSDPAWSPDGQKIAFKSGSNVFVVKADGTGRVQLTNNPLSTPESFRYPGDPDWSPDGTKITYGLHRGDSSHFFDSIHVMNADGSGDTEHYFGPIIVYGPVFSPDGTRIAFSCHAGICVMPAGGLTACCDWPPGVPGTTLFDSYPDWQPLIAGPQRSDYKNGAKFCKAERDFLGDPEFSRQYGGGANAFGKCVSRKP